MEQKLSASELVKKFGSVEAYAAHQWKKDRIEKFSTKFGKDVVDVQVTSEQIIYSDPDLVITKYLILFADGSQASHVEEDYRCR